MSYLFCINLNLSSYIIDHTKQETAQFINYYRNAFLKFKLVLAFNLNRSTIWHNNVVKIHVNEKRISFAYLPVY
jgi:hypothetical protein